ncbi:MAG: histidine--tRNA ligase [Rhodospirillaceae bacterium]|nr:histidine--tRNA ligase [Rhodospirillaceae bacterium]
MKKLQAIRGMNDVLPDQSVTWQFLEDTFSKVVKRFGYQEIRFPIVEQTQLFKRSIGEVTDIVEKEMYSFDDRNGVNLSLRPEGTAGCVRAGEQHGLFYNQQRRLWYQGPMFRHERPQKGRYRQFHQFGVEALGMSGPDIDVEVLQLAHMLWEELKLTEHLTLEINNIGNSEDRKAYARALTEFLTNKTEMLDEDALNRMHSNPMRILDSKNPEVQSVIETAPILSDFLSEDSKSHYAKLKGMLDATGVNYIENARLVRGLDYYNNCVYEWTTSVLGAQGSVCGGGRYDGLVKQLGGKDTYACGFAIGMERLVLMLDSLEKVPISQLKQIDIFIATIGANLVSESLSLANKIRKDYPNLGTLCHCGGGKFNSQLKKAYNCGADVAIILEEESCEGKPINAKIRRLDDSNESKVVKIKEISQELRGFLSI